MASWVAVVTRSTADVAGDDPGVVPDEETCEKAGITVVDTGYQHNDMRDTGPDDAKNSIQTMLNKFLDSTDSSIAPVDTSKTVPKVLTEPGPVTLYAPTPGKPAKATN